MHRLCPPLFALLLTVSTASGVFEVEMPLESLVAKSETIAVVKVDTLDIEREKTVLVVERLFKGSGIERIPVRLKGDGDGHPLDMLARIQPGMQLVVFIAPVSASESMVFAYATDSWFKLRGNLEGNTLKSQFVQGEPYLRKTYGGSVEELINLVDDAQAGRGKLPAIDKEARPALGKTFIDIGPKEKSAGAISAKFELSPAWTGNATPERSEDARGLVSYAVPAFLGLAGVGLLLLLTRSAPSVSAT